jgi:hypothetical protein
MRRKYEARALLSASFCLVFQPLRSTMRAPDAGFESPAERRPSSIASLTAKGRRKRRMLYSMSIAERAERGGRGVAPPDRRFRRWRRAVRRTVRRETAPTEFAACASVTHLTFLSVFAASPSSAGSGSALAEQRYGVRIGRHESRIEHPGLSGCGGPRPHVRGAAPNARGRTSGPLHYRFDRESFRDYNFRQLPA